MVTLAPNKTEENAGCDVCGFSFCSNRNPDMQRNSLLIILSERKKLTFITPDETTRLPSHSISIPPDSNYN